MASVHTSNYSWAITVGRDEFANALRSIARTTHAVDEGDAILTFDGQNLSIEVSGKSCVVTGEGEWPTEVRLPGEILARLASSLPDEDPLTLRVSDGRMHLERLSIPCRWAVFSHRRSTPVRELIPANADAFDILMLRRRCSPEEIDIAGAHSLVEEAENTLSSACGKAASTAKRYGAGWKEFKGLCELHIEEGKRSFRSADQAEVNHIAEIWKILAPFGVETAEIKEVLRSSLKQAWKK